MAVIVSLAAGVMPSSAAADRVITVEPGLWEYTHTLEIPGVLPPSLTPQTECVSEKDAQRKLSDLLDELSQEGGCTVTNLKSYISTVAFDLSCKHEIGAFTLEARGETAFQYGPTEITGVATGVLSIGGQDIPVNAQGEARRIGPCAS